MTDQSSDAPPAYETKNLPHGYAPAAVPFGDSTHVDRGEVGAVEEQAAPAADTPAETPAKTTTRKTAASKDS